jgi:hypothetical protein
MNAPTTTTPFGIQSVVPGLQDVPRNQARSETLTTPAFLRLSEESRNAVNLHLASVGSDYNRFAYSVKDQRKKPDSLCHVLVLGWTYRECIAIIFRAQVVPADS